MGREIFAEVVIENYSDKAPQRAVYLTREELKQIRIMKERGDGKLAREYLIGLAEYQRVKRFKLNF